MKLTKKHIGRLFDVSGSDGSWCYLLLDIKKGELLFYGMDGKYEIHSNKYYDWRPFLSGQLTNKKRHIELGWQTGRREK